MSRRRDELIRRIEDLEEPSDVFQQASSRLRRLVPFDSALWVVTDPGTGLPIAPSRLENVEEGDPSECVAFWRREYEVDDVNPFRHLAQAEVPAASLRQTADPRMSPRFRHFLAPQGIDDELRVVFRAGGHPWGVVSLWRQRGRAPFTSDETDLAASLSKPMAETLRSHARKAREPSEFGPDQPGLLFFDPRGSLVSVNEEARAWVEELPDDPSLPTDLGIDVPLWMMATIFKARSLGKLKTQATARARVQTKRHVWLVCHGSVMRNAGGSVSSMAAMIEPAKAADIAPIVVQAYDLSHREQEITRLIARGATTKKIANHLFLSPHTVRDHVKAIFQKVQVSTRGELVAKLFADHYWPQHDQDVVRVEPD